MSRVQLFRDIGLDVETAVELDDELSRLPARMQRVFIMRAEGYTQEDIAATEGVTQKSISVCLGKMSCLTGIIIGKSVPYINRGEDAT